MQTIQNRNEIKLLISFFSSAISINPTNSLTSFPANTFPDNSLHIL